jgi:hypothetical protein
MDGLSVKVLVCVWGSWGTRLDICSNRVSICIT